jgi:hypothetical protein
LWQELQNLAVKLYNDSPMIWRVLSLDMFEQREQDCCLMGEVCFSCPADLMRALVAASGIDAAIETGTFKAEGTLLLREVVSRVWTVELDAALYERATASHSHRAGITFLQGSSDEVLSKLIADVDEPVIFWLDAHGGMVDHLSQKVFNPAGDNTQCPLIGELQAIRGFCHAASSCILIDDARVFLGPLPQLRAGDWPSLVNIIDLLRTDVDRYITILDDVVIAVPANLRPVVDEWWLKRITGREDRDAHQQALWEAHNPKPRAAARLLVKSVMPMFLRRVYARYRRPASSRTYFSNDLL